MKIIAISTIEGENVKAIKIAILDGVLYIKGKNKMHKSITELYKDYNIYEFISIAWILISTLKG